MAGCDAEVHRSRVVHTDIDTVWDVVKRFGSIGEWLPETLDICYVETPSCGPYTVGCTRRLVLRDSQELLRERLTHHYAGSRRRYFTYEALPYGPEADRSPFPCEVGKLTTTMTISDVTGTGRTYVELYATFACPDRAGARAIEGRLASFFEAQLRGVAEKACLYETEAELPDVLVKFHAMKAFQGHEADLNKVVALWTDAVRSARGYEEKLQVAEQELASTRCLLDQQFRTPQPDGGGDASGGSAAAAGTPDRPLCSLCSATLEAAHASAAPTNDGGGGAGAPARVAAAAPAVPCAASGSWVPPRGGGTCGMLQPAAGVVFSQADLQALFSSLDERDQGFLTPQQLSAYCLSIDVFETEETVGATVKR